MEIFVFDIFLSIFKVTLILFCELNGDPFFIFGLVGGGCNEHVLSD
jgi:hypothetical protein